MFILPQVFTAKKYNMRVSFGSFNEVPLIFIKCGGDLDMDSSTYGRVCLENVLLFFNGDAPLKSNNLQSNQINFRTVSPPTMQTLQDVPILPDDPVPLPYSSRCSAKGAQ